MLAEQFLRFLAAPREFQKQYIPKKNKRYGCELREGYFEGDQDLLLLLVIGCDSLYWEDFQRRYPSAEHPVYLVYSLVFVLTEYASSVLPVLENEDSELPTPTAGVWTLLRELALQALDTAGLSKEPPDIIFEQAVLSHCREV